MIRIRCGAGTVNGKEAVGRTGRIRVYPRASIVRRAPRQHPCSTFSSASPRRSRRRLPRARRQRRRRKRRPRSRPRGPAKRRSPPYLSSRRRSAPTSATPRRCSIPGTPCCPGRRLPQAAQRGPSASGPVSGCRATSCPARLPAPFAAACSTTRRSTNSRQRCSPPTSASTRRSTCSRICGHATGAPLEPIRARCCEPPSRTWSDRSRPMSSSPWCARSSSCWRASMAPARRRRSASSPSGCSSGI